MNYILCDRLSDTNWHRLLVDALLKGPGGRVVAGADGAGEFTAHFELDKARLFCRFCESYRHDREASLIFTDISFQHLPMYYSFLRSAGCGRFRFYGFAHGGFYEPWDLHRVLPAYSSIEREMLHYFTKIFVQTRYHRELLRLSYPELESRVEITGLPLPEIDGVACEKRYNAGYFSRLTPDKGIDLVPAGVHLRRLPKTEYYRELAKYRAVLVPARKETFGYVAIEAVLCGTLPVVPYDFCYPEIFGESPLIYFSRYEEIPSKLEEICGLDAARYRDEVGVLQARLRERRFSVRL